MVRDIRYLWQFNGFESNAEGRPVQDWFDRLPVDDKYEVQDLLRYLRKTQHWPDEVFDPLKGARGIAEIRVPNLKHEVGGVLKEITYRIYGFFGPNAGEFTFLHGTDKDVKNDVQGKRIAEDRLVELRRDPIRTRVHKFRDAGINPAPQTGKTSPN